MKNTFAILVAFLALTFPALAQFHPAGPFLVDVLKGKSPMTIATTAITNITIPAYIGKDGFSVTPYFWGGGAGTANLAILGCPLIDGVNTNNTFTALGNVAMAGTTPVRNSVFVPSTTFPGCGAIDIILTNAHTGNLVITNLYITAW